MFYFSYIFHLYNGDHGNYELEATNNFISVCENLKSNANFENIPNAVDTIIMNCHNFNLYADLNTKALIIEDIRDIFDGPDKESSIYLLSAMSDVINLFELTKLKYGENKIRKKAEKNQSKSFSTQFPSCQNDNINSFSELKNQTHFVGCLKKLEFYLSFLKHCYSRSQWNVEF